MSASYSFDGESVVFLDPVPVRFRVNSPSFFFLYLAAPAYARQ